MSRYLGKPLVRLLECYVLGAIDELSVGEVGDLRSMELKLAEIYGIQGSWDQIIAGVMEFPENMPNLILEMWKKNQVIASQLGLALLPQQFAEKFVDDNFL